ncbi:MAG: FtsX-like permease family protein [Flavobacteriales bacterium]|nr:FtsX-like permease family protein [Flavobacteriales bacterium]
MNVSSFIAKRYLFAKKSRNIINVISFISFFGLLVSSASLVIILSGFNGLQFLVEEMYGNYSADLFITPIDGKSIEKTHPVYKDLLTQKEVLSLSKVIEETVMIKKESRWITAKIKGVDTSIYSHTFFEPSLTEGNGSLYFNGYPMVLLGYGLQDQLQVSSDPRYLNDIQIYGLSRKKKLSVQGSNTFDSKKTQIAGVFSINPELDNSTLFAPYNFVNRLFEYDNEATSIEINTKSVEKVKTYVQNKYGNDFNIKTNEEKNDLIYATNDTEKWMVLCILIFILLLSTFNTMASITILIIDKKQDIKSLIAMGSKYATIRNVFFKEGLFICLSGSLAGLLIGVIVCFLQNHFHIIELNIDYWPVLVKTNDLILILVILLITGTLASFIPSQILMKRLIKRDL